MADPIVYLAQPMNQDLAGRIRDRLGGKIFMFYSGPILVGADPPLGVNNILLGECQVSTPAGGAVDSTGRFYFNDIGADIQTNANGICTFAIVSNLDDSGREILLNVGIDNEALIASTNVFTVGGNAKIVSLWLQHHNGI